MSWRSPSPLLFDPADRFHVETAISLPAVGLAASWAPLPTEWKQPRVQLPAAEVHDTVSLASVLRARRTCLEFNPEARLTVAQLGTLLTSAAGLSEGEVAGGPRRTAPSPGATYPISVRLISLRNADLVPGVYLFDAETSELEGIRAGEYGDALVPLTLGQTTVRDAAAILALVGDYRRVWSRYGPRGYRYMLLESGHIAQNLYLVGAALSLDVKAIGGFSDTGINRLLALDGFNQRSLYLVGVNGRESSRSTARESA